MVYIPNCLVEIGIDGTRLRQFVCPGTVLCCSRRVVGWPGVDVGADSVWGPAGALADLDDCVGGGGREHAEERFVVGHGECHQQGGGRLMGVSGCRKGKAGGGVVDRQREGAGLVPLDQKA